MKLSAEGKLRLAVKLAFIAGVGTVVDSAYAQTSGSTQLTGVQVTGSRIKQASLTSSSSMTVISDKELQYQGTTNVETLINNMPQAFAGFSTQDSNGATGTATVNLRGLGPQETLVLIDGKRLMPGDPLQTPPSADLNFIPAALIDRIDILSGGASAVYGSDAVAGVVNFIMKKDFQGFRVDSQFSRTDHSDGTTYDTTLIWGSNFSGGKGNVTAYAGYINQGAVTQDKRGFSACSLKTPASGDKHVCAGSRVIPSNRIYSYDGNGYGIVDPAGTATILPDDPNVTFNFAPYNFLQRPTKRYILGGFAHDALNKHVDIYGSAMFMDNHTLAAVAPSGLFGTVATTPCSNPLLSAQEVGFLCPNAGQTTATVAILDRLTALGPRVGDIRHTDYRINTGVRGDIIDGVTYDVSAQHGTVIFASGTLNYLNTTNALKALNVVSVGGVPTCQSVVDGTDPNCVPLNLWQTNKITPEAVNYIKANGYAQAHQTEDVFNASVSADLGRYGARIPLAKNGIGVAGGWEYRRESLEYDPDAAIAAGTLGGVGGPSPGIVGYFKVPEVFSEVNIPIIEDMPGAKLLQIDGAYRWSNYSTANDAHTWKVGIKYAPTPDAQLRASFARATRAPSVNELFSPSAFGLIGGSDPCAKTNLYVLDSSGNPTSTLANGAPTLAECQATGVTAAQYGTPGTTPGTITDCNSGQCNINTGGSTALKPELSITRSLGIVITPRAIKNFTATIDYFDIYIDGAVGILPTSAAFASCFAGLASACNSFHRGPSGRLSGDTAVGNYFDDFNQNTGSLRTRGIDVELNYKLRLRDIGMGNNGQFVANYVSTYLLTVDNESGPGTGIYNCAGLYGATCNGTSGGPNPRYKHKMRLTWDSPFGLSLSANWRYFGGVALDSNTADPNLSNGKQDKIDGLIGAKQYVDLSAAYTLPIKAQNITLRAGVSNVTGQNPPTVSSNSPNAISSPPFGNGNTFPNVYDSLGRIMFVGVTADF